MPEAHEYRLEMLTIGPLCRYASDIALVYKVNISFRA